MKVDLALIQDDFPELDREGNRARVTQAAHEAAAAGCEILALPELWCSGYSLAKISAISDWDQEFDFLADLSLTSGLAILGGSLVEPAEDDRFYNCAVAFDAGQEVARYRKTHLFAPLREDRYLHAGERLPEVFELRGLRCALSVCYDLRFPELYRAIALQGVDLMFVPAQWPLPRVQHWRTLLAARAIENQCFVLGVNRKGIYGETEFAGHSQLIDPWGSVVLNATDSRGTLITSIDPTLIADAKKRLPTLKDRRKDLY